MSEQTQATNADWKVFQGDNREPHDAIAHLPPAPPWRPFGGEASSSRRQRRGETFQARSDEIKMVNAALYLRRPLLITGKPGTGKSSLAYAVAHELKLGEVLYWPITTRTSLQDGLYTYDAIGRLQAVKQSENDANYVEDPQTIADYITLGPLGTALLPSPHPRVLVVDEIDKSDIDLPNDLLTIFEEGRFEIPELVRLEPDELENYAEENGSETEQSQKPEPNEVSVRTAYTDEKDPITRSERKINIRGGRINCSEFPLVILTSNGERDFPPPFLRRCLRLNMQDPKLKDLERIVQAHLKDCDVTDDEIKRLIQTFLARRDTDKEQLATDQLLNALFMIVRQRGGLYEDRDSLLAHLLAPLDRPLEIKPSRKAEDGKGRGNQNAGASGTSGS
ncbi:MAG: MoxR family ATPase [Phormidesmis sp.]